MLLHDYYLLCMIELMQDKSNRQCPELQPARIRGKKWRWDINDFRSLRKCHLVTKNILDKSWKRNAATVIRLYKWLLVDEISQSVNYFKVTSLHKPFSALTRMHMTHGLTTSGSQEQARLATYCSQRAQ